MRRRKFPHTQLRDALRTLQEWCDLMEHSHYTAGFRKATVWSQIYLFTPDGDARYGYTSVDKGVLFPSHGGDTASFDQTML